MGAELIKPYNHNKIANVIHYIEQNLHAELNVTQLSDLACNAYDRFHHLFTAVAGEPVHQHIKRVRMERAAFLLRYTHFTVGDVAYLVGFGSNASLAKAFSQHFDNSPSAFRAARKNTVSAEKADYLVNYEHPQIVRAPTRKMVFFRTYQLQQIPATWQRLFALQTSLETLTGKPLRVLANQTPELIFKTPDYPDITRPGFCRWDIGLAADQDTLKKMRSLDENELLKEETLPAGKYAVFVHHGPGINIMDSYAAILYHGLDRLGYRLAHSFTFHKYLQVDLPHHSVAELHFPVY